MSTPTPNNHFWAVMLKAPKSETSMDTSMEKSDWSGSADNCQSHAEPL
jgi:hypothetical protein